MLVNNLAQPAQLLPVLSQKQWACRCRRLQYCGGGVSGVWSADYAERKGGPDVSCLAGASSGPSDTRIA